jgi:hypothetical protein
VPGGTQGETSKTTRLEALNSGEPDPPDWVWAQVFEGLILEYHEWFRPGIVLIKHCLRFFNCSVTVSELLK